MMLPMETQRLDRMEAARIVLAGSLRSCTSQKTEPQLIFVNKPHCHYSNNVMFCITHLPLVSSGFSADHPLANYLLQL